ncbi:MAG: hypothetical protein HY901_02215 [Deltaproteobacteria bacterium]|nr:hypothetical protein [Deltaproteobacteria bacterium]
MTSKLTAEEERVLEQLKADAKRARQVPGTGGPSLEGKFGFPIGIADDGQPFPVPRVGEEVPEPPAKRGKR